MKTSSIIQLILDLATYGYILSNDWKSKSKGRATQELAQSFLALMSRWERFDYTAKLRLNLGGMCQIKDGLLGYSLRQDSFTFYHFDLIRDQAQPSALATTAKSMPVADVTPWIEYPSKPDIFVSDCDVTQDILVYSHSPSG